MTARVAIVTGAGAGIGRAIAIALAATGAVVIAVDLIADDAEVTAAIIRDAGGKAHAFAIDIAADDAPARITGFATAQAEAPTILINNAAAGGGEAFADVTPARYDRIFAVSGKAAFFLAQAMLPGMQAARWGRIVNIASLIAGRGAPGNPHYAGAKAAMIGFARAWAVELAPHGITANTVLPALTDTPMTRAAISEAGIAERAAAVPAGRLATPQDVAALVAYLCSDAAAFLTGQAISPNGGEYVGAL